jgi:hypothetical protein
MKRFPFRTMFFCVFLPPLCYALTLQGLGRYLQDREVSALNRILIQNTAALYEGRYTVKDEIDRNIRVYLKESFKYKIGISANILVKTKDNRILYPIRFQLEMGGSQPSGDFAEGPEHGSLNYVETASENYRILNEGLVLSVELQVKHNTWLSNIILLFYVFLSLFVLQHSIRKRLKETETEENEQRALVEQLTDELRRVESRLREEEGKEAEYQSRISELTKDKTELSKDIDGLLEEVEDQEDGLRTQRELRENLEKEVNRLRGEVDRVREKLPRPKHRNKASEVAERRFRVLYKNLLFTDRAIEGFTALTEEYQLKAEEVVHRLNQDEALVTVRRKVFGKGGKLDVLEADFSYSGRLYFQKDSQSTKTRILAVGTKNSQEKDIAFLENLK